ncbi:MAG: hypothetical protein M1830_009214 [Pleopsidium flavum]|nr:MAG: hypothetical protein M1830_009214 [Pleopsidium flavum]
MSLLRPLLLFWLTVLSLSNFAIARPNAGDILHPQEPKAGRAAEQHGLLRRSNGTSSGAPNITVQQTLANSVITFITPSPSAAGIPITRQSQVITTYAPQVTICELPRFAYSNTSNASYPATGGNASLPTGRGTFSTSSTARGNFSTSPTTVICSTVYSAVTTEICSTLLTGGGQLLTVTDCSQDVTFSTDHGYNMSTSTMLAPDSVIRKGTAITTPIPSTTTYMVPSTTYYMAPWQAVATGIPSQVQAKICSSAPDGGQDCTSVFEKWVVTTVQVVQSFTQTINLTTTLSGGTRVIVDATSTIDVTNAMTTISISTELPASSTVALPSVSTTRISSPALAPTSTIADILGSVTNTL